MRGQRHAPAAVYPRDRPGTHLQVAGWAPEPVCTSAENLAPTGIRSPDRPARSQSLYRLYLDHKNKRNTVKYWSKIVPIHTINACMGHRGIAQPILNLDTRLRSADNLKPPPFYLPYPLYRRVGGPQRRSGRFEEEKKISCPCKDSNTRSWSSQQGKNTFILICTVLKMIR